MRSEQRTFLKAIRAFGVRGASAPRTLSGAEENRGKKVFR